jgi:hypothetical protein
MRRTKLINPRLTVCYVPQTLPELQFEELLNEKEFTPDNLDAKVEIFLLIFWLSQEGQATSPCLLVPSTSFSNGFPQSTHIYS